MSTQDVLQSRMPAIGQPLDRVDGRAKVTGVAEYTADVPVNNLAYAVLITSTIARGRIKTFDTGRAEQIPGVVAILTPFNAPRLPNGSLAAQGYEPRSGTGWESTRGPASEHPHRPSDRLLTLLQEDTVFYSRQPIGIAIAETLESATEAARRVHVEYEEQEPATRLNEQRSQAFVPEETGSISVEMQTSQGDVQAGLQAAAVRVEETYTTPVETHNAMEPHATTAIWQGDQLTLYDSTQGVFPDRKRVAVLFGLAPERVRVVSRYLGGGFGSKGPVWSHVPLAALAARHVRRPVKLVLERSQMFGPVGFRSETEQTLRLGASGDGKLTAIEHDSLSQTSMFDTYVELAALPSRMMYACPNIATAHRVAHLNSGTPAYMRAPGQAPGMFALESAMDELAYHLNMDPIELRLRNYADKDPETGKPWSSKSLRDCYHLGAERFGWSRRNPQPRSTRDGHYLVGYGMASATYPMHRSPASARATLFTDGHVLVQSGTQDIGTGTYTVMSQIAAEALGVPVDQVHFELGDTDLPQAPLSAGSRTVASTGSAVLLAAQALRDKLVELATSDSASPLHRTKPSEIEARDGQLYLKSDPKKREGYGSLLHRNGLRLMQASADSHAGEEVDRYSMQAFGAHFAEVRVDPAVGVVHVSRYVGAFGAGRIVNAKTARSQLIGGIVWGVGMALMEVTHTDPHFGRITNADLAEYLVPVNADIGSIDILFVKEDDPHVNPLGAKGIGEIGIVGAPAAIANAVFHATGRRIRKLPITPDKLL